MDRGPALALQVVLVVELQTKVYMKVRSHRKGPYDGLLLVESLMIIALASQFHVYFLCLGAC